MILRDHNHLGIVRLTASVRHGLRMPPGDEAGHPLGHELVEIVAHRHRFPVGEVVGFQNRLMVSELRRRGQVGAAHAARWYSWISPARTLPRSYSRGRQVGYLSHGG